MARISMRNSQKATFAEVFEVYISAVTARGVKDKTLATYKQHFHAISKRLDVSILINRLNSTVLDNMILQMRKEGLSDSSINSYTRTLKCFLSWCNEEGYTKAKQNKFNSNGRGSASSVCQFITYIHQELDYLIIHHTIQCHTQPMGLIHVPTREDARFLPEGANQSGIAFEIHHTDFTVAGKFQILSGDVHNDGKPLPVPIVPEHQKTGILGKEMLADRAVIVRQIGS